MLRVTGGSVRAPGVLLVSLLLLTPVLLDTRRGPLPCRGCADAGLLDAAAPALQAVQCIVEPQTEPATAGLCLTHDTVSLQLAQEQ